jgi:hypothetical protein
VIITGGAIQEYVLPKSQVKGFIGAEVSLNVTIGIRVVQIFPTVKVI